MKKFSKIGKNINNKKFKVNSKNDIYSLIKENINVNLTPLNENAKIEDISIDMNNSIDIMVEKINLYVNKKVNEEKIKVLNSIKTSISTGVLDLRKINEEIESCGCSELCPPPEYSEPEYYENVDKTDDFSTMFIDDYDDDLDIVEDNVEYITTNESIKGTNVDLSDKFIKIINEGKNISWEEFFNINNVPNELRTNELVDNIYNEVRSKKSIK